MCYFIMTIIFSEHVIITFVVKRKKSKLCFSFKNVFVEGKHQLNKLNFSIMIKF